ncbi:MAG: DUF2341 domain-containing protein [Candidatus Kapaibacterium sp.]
MTNYAVNVVVNTASLIATGKMRADGADMRFTDNDCCTPLNYWIESGLNSSFTSVWVNIPTLAGSSTKTIYLLYGNPAATPASNANLVFPLYDDFNGASLDLTKWTPPRVGGSGSASVSGGSLNFTAPTSSAVTVKSLTAFPTPIILEAQVLGYGGNWPNIAQLIGGTETGYTLFYGADRNPPLCFGPTVANGPHYSAYLENQVAAPGVGLWTITWTSAAKTATFPGGSITYQLQTAPVSYTLPATMNVAMGCLQTNGTATNGTLSLDWVRVRTYTSPQPEASVGQEGLNAPTTITQQPVNRNGCQGQVATFSVTATGSSLTYQWRKNGVNIPGANASSYSIGSPIASDAGTYDVVISASCASTVTSSPATLSIVAPTLITSQPTGASYCGNAVPTTFSVTATAANITYQWRKDGVNIPGANTNSYTIPAPTPADNGVYDVVVGGDCGPVTSNGARLTVTQPPQFTQQPFDTTSGNMGGSIRDYTFSVGTGALLPQPESGATQLFKAPAGSGGVDDSVRLINIGFPFSFDGATYNQISVSSNGVIGVGPIPVTTTGINAIIGGGGVPIIAPFWDDLRVGGGAGGCGNPLVSYYISGTAPNRALVIDYKSVELTKQTTAWGSFQVRLYERSSAIEFYYGQMSPCSICSTGTQGCFPNSATIGIASSGAVAFQSVSLASTPTVSLTNPNDANDLNTTPITNGRLLTFTPPSSICRDRPFTLVAGAVGTGLRYQWRFNGKPIEGATGPSYTRYGQIYDEGIYDVVISGSCPVTFASNPVRVRITTEPIIVNQPRDQSVLIGQPVTFRADVISGGNLTYQWQKDGVNIPNATQSTYSIASVTTKDIGDYNVVVYGTQCQFYLTVSNRASLLIDAPLGIAKNPDNQVLCSGGTASFTVTASGNGLVYQWRKNGVNIPGTNKRIFTIANVTAADAGTYDVVINGEFGQSSTSGQATLTVNPLASIAAQPSNQTVCLGQAVAFNVTANGTGLTYQWRKNGTALTSSTTNTLNISAAAIADTGRYDVMVIGQCNDTIASISAFLTVNLPPAITLEPIPANQKVKSGTQVVYTAAATGTSATYQWYKNGAPIGGAVTPTYTIPSAQLADAGTYYVMVNGVCPPAATSASVKLTVDTSSLGVPGIVDAAKGARMTVVPQPARGLTRLAIEFPSGVTPREGTSVKLYDAAGKVVLDLSTSFARSGWTAADFDAATLATGAYYCRVEVGGWSSNLGMVMVTK